jgi:hypothetical protein
VNKKTEHKKPQKPPKEITQFPQQNQLKIFPQTFKIQPQKPQNIASQTPLEPRIHRKHVPIPSLTKIPTQKIKLKKIPNLSLLSDISN